jgi:glucose dehydrogenase
MSARRLLDASKTFVAVVLWLAGLFLVGGSLLLSLLGGGPTAHYLFTGAAFITLSVLLFRWSPPVAATVPAEKALD